jgi:hypothetical protein
VSPEEKSQTINKELLFLIQKTIRFYSFTTPGQLQRNAWSRSSEYTGSALRAYQQFFTSTETYGTNKNLHPGLSVKSCSLYQDFKKSTDTSLYTSMAPTLAKS